MKTSTGIWIYKAVGMVAIDKVAMSLTINAQDLLFTTTGGKQAGKTELHPPIGSVTTLDGIRQLDESSSWKQ